MLFLKLSAYRYGFELSNEPLFIIIAQEAAKLWPIKVGDLKKNPGLDSGPHSSGPCGRIFFRLPTLTGHSFATPWAMMMKSGSFESPKPYLLAPNLKNSIIPLLTSVRTSWKVTIYCINRALLILKWKPLYLLTWVSLHQLESVSKTFKIYIRQFEKRRVFVNKIYLNCFV